MAETFRELQGLRVLRPAQNRVRRQHQVPVPVLAQVLVPVSQERKR